MKKTKTARIQDLLALGKSQADIAKSLKVSRQLVYQVARKTRENSEFVSKVFEKVGYTKPKTRMLSATESLYERYNKGNTARPKLRMMSAIEETNRDVGKLFNEAYEKYKDDDTVNHPLHYRAGGVETIDFIEAKDLNYRLGNVVKYVSRAGKKESDPLEDLKKARWYLDREIAARERA
jgi:transcriptional regulator with XRE-family HTH domain